MVSETFDPSHLRPLMLVPMDMRCCYHTTAPQLWNRSRPDYAYQCWPGNTVLVTRRKGAASPEGVPIFIVSQLGFQHAFFKDAYYVPLRLRPPKPRTEGSDVQATFMEEEPATANLSAGARIYLADLGITNPDKDEETATLVWHHALAIGYAPAYLSEHTEAIRGDWPRIPLPASESLLRTSGALGQEIAELLDTERPYGSAQATARLRAVLNVMGSVSRVDGGQINEAAGELCVRGNWGYASTNGIVMGGTGRLVTREYTPDELQAIENGTSSIGLSLEDALARLGKTTCDVYLNDVAYWKNVPSAVWAYRIGGYQVIKKWLSYREHDLLGRPLSVQEAQYVREMARRLAAVLLMGPALDANYQAVVADAYAWPGKSAETRTEA